jgi:dimeric dUTPase (all-alpha-NTP-PPase superfamily)
MAGQFWLANFVLNSRRYRVIKNMRLDITQQVSSMLELQDSMNNKVHPDWRNQSYEWYRAVWVECAELMDHYGWKWWKKQQPDMEQVNLEIIDIWHFGLSYLLNNTDLDNANLAKAIGADLAAATAKKDFHVALESFTEWTLVNRGFSVKEFVVLMNAASMSFDQLYTGYIGKNVLNFFRQDHGYKDGSYIKEWDGREDNEHLVEICTTLDISSVSFKDDVYRNLKLRYITLANAG